MGCNERFPKNTLLRVVRDPDGNVSLDFTGKKSGRGAYICKCGDCLKKAEKINALSHTFSQSVDREIYSRLARERDEQDG